MRIGLVTPGFSASESDWCVPALLDLARVLARDHDVYVLTLRYPPRRRRYRVHGATVDALAGGTRRGLSRVALLTNAVLTLHRESRRRRLEVLHALWAHEPGGVVTAVGSLLGLPTVVSILGGELVSLPALGYGGQVWWSNRWLVKNALSRADAVTIGSAGMWDLAARYTDTANLSVAPLGVDTGRFRPSVDDAGPVLAGSPTILCVASLTPVKDQAVLLHAVSLIGDHLPGVHLHLIGTGESEHDLRQLAHRLGLESRMTFHGAIAHDRLPAYYRAADACVLSSRFESQAMVIVEAAACGRRTLGTDVGVLRKVGGEAAAVPPGNPGALADLLVTELRQPLPRRPWLGGAQLEADYGLRAACARFVAIYRRLAQVP